MSALTVTSAREEDRGRALDLLVQAFAADPVERWLYPEDREYFAHFPGFVASVGERAFAASSAWLLGDCAAVALWLPPDTNPDGEAIVAALRASVPAEKLADLFAVFEQLDAAHPRLPHWYLPWFGVDPAIQGRGLGSELMRHCLEVVDRAHLPAYLETPNPRTVAFYERHGFEVTGEVSAGACPPLFLMLRAPR